MCCKAFRWFLVCSGVNGVNLQPFGVRVDYYQEHVSHERTCVVYVDTWPWLFWKFPRMQRCDRWCFLCYLALMATFDLVLECIVQMRQAPLYAVCPDVSHGAHPPGTAVLVAVPRIRHPWWCRLFYSCEIWRDIFLSILWMICPARTLSKALSARRKILSALLPHMNISHIITNTDELSF